MPQPIRLVLVLHDHQPVGNFDSVFEQSYQDSYQPFLDVFEPYKSLPVVLHTSGSLMEWLAVRHPEYLDRLAGLISQGRMEILGGPFYEPIMSMIPPRDRVGQIRTYTEWLQDRLGAQVRGMWVPERVWEQSMTGDLAAAGIQYTLLDDSHFKAAGLAEDELTGYYLTEDDGRTLGVFPDSEPLRYMIPFAAPEETINYLRRFAEQHPGATAVFGDDGEKFGAWPETKKHVYQDGWLRRFLDLLVQNQDWIKVTTLAEAYDNVAPVGRIYLPEGSYREMTEWVLPAEQLAEYASVRREMEHDPRWPKISRFVRGGFWRNFKVKYSETNEMYARMMLVSKRYQQLVEAGVKNDWMDHARTCLYRGQCNCSYWHGAFGGVYLPHLRNAIFNQLIAADNLLDRAAGRPEQYVELNADDYDFDGRQEILLGSNKLTGLIAPHRGGQLYELDVRTICHNVLATLTRHPEAYHRKVLGGSDGRNDVAGVSDKVIFKQAGLDSRLQYDTYPRKSLVDHFFDPEAALTSVALGEATERGDFITRTYEAKMRRNPHRMQLQMSAVGAVSVAGSSGHHRIKITKGVTLESGSSTLEIAYVLEGLPTDRPLHFGVEFNFAGLPSGADDRYFYSDERRRLGQLGTRLDLREVRELGLVDEWLGIDIDLVLNRPTNIWTFPIESVSQSEGGFELVHQSVAVLPHWIVQPDADGRWSVTMTLALDTTLAESRNEKSLAAVT